METSLQEKERNEDKKKKSLFTGKMKSENKEKVKKEKKERVKKEKPAKVKEKKERVKKVRTKKEKGKDEGGKEKKISRMPKTGKTKKVKNAKKSASMKTRILVTVLPVTIIAMTALTIISVQYGSKNINSAISAQMEAELQVQGNKVTNYFTKIIDIANTLASTVNSSYQQVNLDSFETELVDIVTQNDALIGSGIWFESGYFTNGIEKIEANATVSTAEQGMADSEEESSEEETIYYVGPYAIRDNGKIQITYKYSTADNSYFKQKFYMMAKEVKSTILTEPMYDITARSFKVTAIVPMFTDNVFIGCVTVDVSLDNIKEFIGNAAIGDNGKATLLSAEGKYLAGSTEKNVSKAITKAQEQSPSLLHAKLGAFIAADHYRIKDQDILNAIENHTTGRPAMSLLEKIVFVADYIEPRRNKASNLSKLRQMAFIDIDRTVYEIMDQTLRYLKTKKVPIDSLTKKSCDYYRALCGEKDVENETERN